MQNLNLIELNLVRLIIILAANDDIGISTNRASVIEDRMYKTGRFSTYRHRQRPSDDSASTAVAGPAKLHAVYKLYTCACVSVRGR